METEKYCEAFMEAYEQEFRVMSAKMDALHQVIDELSLKLTAASLVPYPEQTELAQNVATDRTTANPELSHKDVLVDSQSFDIDRHSGDRPLTPEIQIQRLTAQLTAAYNRIAVLEEQLLAQRVH